MKRVLHFGAWMALVILAGAIIFRAVWVASRTPAGWSTLHDHLAAALPPILTSKQSSESTVWYAAKRRLLQEADQIASDPKSTAGDCMGTAWLLAGAIWARFSPDPTIVGRVVWCKPPRNPFIDEWHNIDQRMVASAQKMAAKATSLDPEHADWWRLRALLMLWDYSELDVDGLQEGSKHDPDNALYDYLLASATMNRALAQREAADAQASPPANREEFETGIQHYERAESKKSLLCGEQGLAAIATTLRSMDVPISVKLTWSNPAMFELATEELLHRIDSPVTEANVRNLSPTEANAIKLAKHSTWLLQIAVAPETLAIKDRRVNSTSASMRQSLSSHLRSLLAADDQRHELGLFMSITSVATAGMAVMFLAFGLAAWVCVAIAGKSQAPVTPGSFLGAFIRFCSVLGLSFGFLGLAAAFDAQLQDYPWPIGCGLVVILAWVSWMIARLARFVWRQSRLTRQQRSSYFQLARWSVVVCNASIFLIALLCVIDHRFREVARGLLLGFPSSILPRPSIDQIATEALGVPVHTIAMAVLQWSARGGALFAVGITLLWLMFCEFRRTPSEATNGGRIATSLRYAGRWALWLALLLFLTSLAATSQWIGYLHDAYLRDLSRIGDHAWLAKMEEDQAKLLEINPATSQAH